MSYDAAITSKAANHSRAFYSYSTKVTVHFHSTMGRRLHTEAYVKLGRCGLAAKALVCIGGKD